MAIINTGLLTRAIRGEFFQRFEAEKTEFQNLCTRLVSKTATETYKWLGTVPQMREWLTGRLAKGLRTESYDVENLTYEATLEVDRNEVKDDQTGQIMIRVAELAERGATHKDYLVAQLLINGATSGFNAYDGVSFFNDAHVSGKSGSQDNKLTYSATDADAPTTAECKGALAQATAAMRQFKDDQGEVRGLGLSGLIVICHPGVFWHWSEALKAALISNTTNIMQGIARVVDLPWLTDQSKWYLLKTDKAVRPLIFQDREPIEFAALADGSEEEFKRRKFLYGIAARYRITYGDWMMAVETNFT